MTAAHNRTAVPATSAGWIAFSSESRVLVVGGSPNDEFVATLWEVIGSPDGLQRTLDLVTSNGLSATPPFALLDFTEGLRVIVRGGVTVGVTHAAGTENVSGVGVSTWIERSIPGTETVALTVVGAEAADVPALPLVTGAAWISSLAVAFGDPASVPRPISETVATPEKAATPAVTPPPVVTPPVVTPPVVTPPVAAAPVAAAPVITPPPVAAPVPVPTPEPVAVPVEIDLEATVTEAPDIETPDIETTITEATVTKAAVTEAPAAEVDDEPDDGETRVSTRRAGRTQAAAAEAENAQAAEVPDDAAEGDHDGHTVLTSDIAALRARRKPTSGGAASPTGDAAPLVSLVLADGTREPLSQPILVGRAPSVSQVSGGKMPKLITVGGPDQDISRTHVRFVLEGGTVVVTDLHSRNGTMIAMPGKDAQKLRAGEPTSVIVGTVVDLGGGVTFTIDEA